MIAYFKKKEAMISQQYRVLSDPNSARQGNVMVQSTDSGAKLAIFILLPPLAI